MAFAGLQAQDRLDAGAPEAILGGDERLAMYDRSVPHADKLTNLARPLVRQNPGISGDARVGAELGILTTGGPEILRHLAIEDAGLATSGLHHLQELTGELELVEALRRPDGRVVGVPALAVLALEVAALRRQQLGVVVVEQANHRRSPDATRDGRR